MIWEVSPCSQLAGRIAVPGSKSHTIRAVVAALLGEGTSEIHAPLYSADTRSALAAARALGARVDETPALWKITGCGKNFTPTAGTIDLGNSGTTMRIITAVSALGKSKISFVRPTQGHAYELEGSADGKQWTRIGGHADIRKMSPHTDAIDIPLRYLRVRIASGIRDVWEWIVEEAQSKDFAGAKWIAMDADSTILFPHIHLLSSKHKWDAD